MTDESIQAIRTARDNPNAIEWISLDRFRIWYSKITKDGTELFCKEYEVKEII